MESKTSFFSKALYVKNIKRFFPWSICYALIVILVTPVTEIINYNNYTRWYDWKETEILSSMTARALETAPVMSAIFCSAASVLAAMFLYSYLCGEKSADMFHALPVKRETHFITTFLSGMTLLIIPLILSEGISAVFALCIGFQKLALVHAKLLGVYILVTFLFFSIGSFCAILAGNTAAVPILYGILNFFSVGIAMLIDLLRTRFLFGLSNTSYMPKVLMALSPSVWLYSKSFDISYTYTTISDTLTRETISYCIHWRPLAVYTVGACILILLSILLYRKRPVECAGDTLAFPQISWIIQVIAGIISGLFITGIFYSYADVYSEVLTVIIFLIGSLPGFFAARMLIQKNFFIFKKSIRGFCVFAAASLAVMLFFILDPAGIEDRTPDAENITGVKLDGSYNTISDADIIEEALSLHQRILNDKDELKNEYNEYMEKGDGYEYEYVTLSFVLKNGETFERCYPITETDTEILDTSSIFYQYYVLMNEPQVLINLYFYEGFSSDDLSYAEYCDWTDGYYYSSFTDEQLTALADAVLKDIEEGNLIGYQYYPYSGELVRENLDNPYVYSENTDTCSYIDFMVNSVEPSEYTDHYYLGTYEAINYDYSAYEYTQTIYLQTTMTNTIQLLEEYGVINESHPLTTSYEYNSIYEDDEYYYEEDIEYDYEYYID